MGILTLISSQRQPKMDSEGDSESSEFEEKAGRKILLAKKKVPPHSGRDTWQKLRLPTSQVYTLENANSNFLSKPTQSSYSKQDKRDRTYKLLVEQKNLNLNQAKL